MATLLQGNTMILGLEMLGRESTKETTPSKPLVVKIVTASGELIIKAASLRFGMFFIKNIVCNMNYYLRLRRKACNFWH